MRYFIDGDQIAIVADTFINLQESPVCFIPLHCQLAHQLILYEKPWEEMTNGSDENGSEVSNRDFAQK